MAQLLHKGKIILNSMICKTSAFSIAVGLMFASKKRIKDGLCLVVPSRKDERILASVTNLFVFSSLGVLFVNLNKNVVDKATLYPFQLIYTPKRPCKYIIECEKSMLNKIMVGDEIKIVDS